MTDPVLSIEKKVKCTRCQASGKIQSIKPGPDFTDCPTCLGEGYVITYQAVSEEQLDEGVALGVELAQLRQAKETALLAAGSMLRTFASVRETLVHVEGGLDAITRAIKLASEGEAQAAALITLLREVGVQ